MIRVTDIVEAVAEAFDIPVRTIQGGSRSDHVVRPRHAIAYLIARLRPDVDLRTIAKAMGCTDNTSAIYAIEKTEERRATIEGFADTLIRAEAIVRARTAGRETRQAVRLAPHLPGSPDRWAMWNAAQKGTAYVETA